MALLENVFSFYSYGVDIGLSAGYVKFCAWYGKDKLLSTCNLN